jgi:hypothetical protein
MHEFWLWCGFKSLKILVKILKNNCEHLCTRFEKDLKRKEKKQTNLTHLHTPRPIPAIGLRGPPAPAPAPSPSCGHRQVGPTCRPLLLPLAAPHLLCFLSGCRCRPSPALLGLPTFNQCHQGAVKPPFTSSPSILPVTPSRAHPLDGNQGRRPPHGHQWPLPWPPASPLPLPYKSRARAPACTLSATVDALQLSSTR